ncbi:MAG: RluA family pseudouridine synthase [Myxococcota bacterium]
MLEILKLGEGFAVLNKPSGLLSIPGRTIHDSVASRVPWIVPGAHGPIVAHRLDQDTSGVMVVGLTPADHRALSIAFANGHVAKRYVARLGEDPSEESGTIELALRADLDDRPRQVVHPRGKRSLTRWRRLGARRIALVPEQGRTHQLRVHLSSGLGLPIDGDRLYGGAVASRLMLHATHLEFPHPRTGSPVAVSSAPPF